jgi:hypothetical protein
MPWSASSLGEGLAKKYLEVIAAFIQTASIDMGCATIAKAIQDGLDQLASAIDQLNDDEHCRGDQGAGRCRSTPSHVAEASRERAIPEGPRPSGGAQSE